MSSNTVSLKLPQHSAKAFPKKWDDSSLAQTRQSLLKLALGESHSRSFIDKALAIISKQLGFNVSYVEPACHTNELSESLAQSMKCFTVVAQDNPIGALIADQTALAAENISYESMQEIADIIGISALSLRQNEDLAALEDESEEMLQYAPDVIFVTDMNGIIKMANYKAHAFLGAETGTLAGKSIVALFDNQALDVDGLLTFGQCGKKFEVEILGQLGRRLASFTVSLVNQENDELQMLMVGRDVTTERQAELALRRTERSTMMAQTIDYLLHEVNNPLGALLSNISTVIRKNDRLQKGTKGSVAPSHSAEMESEFEAVGAALRNAKKAGLRINDAMKILRNANQKRTLSGPKIVDASFELGLAISGLEQEHKKIHIIKSLDAMPPIKAPPLHLSEVFGAILKNAAEAVESVTRDSRQIWVTGGIRNKQLTVTIEDNGPGIPQDYKDKIFMPFFTTKPLGHSIGLGLPMAKDMTKRVGGTIEVLTSTKLGGACFRISFPLR